MSENTEPSPWYTWLQDTSNPLVNKEAFMAGWDAARAADAEEIANLRTANTLNSNNVKYLLAERDALAQQIAAVRAWRRNPWKNGVTAWHELDRILDPSPVTSESETNR